MTVDNKYFHSPAQTAKLKYDVDCLARHIETLEESLENARKKFDTMQKEMISNCNHDYQNTGEEWTPPSGNITIEMWQVECKKCGHTTWKIKKGDVE